MRSLGFLLVAVLLVLPSLVRVTQHVSASQDTTPIRFNRGFNQPQAKCRVARPDDHVVQCAALRPVDAHPLPIQRAPAADDTLRPASTPIRTPDPLRGPPLASLA